jgi:hypothetical protein
MCRRGKGSDHAGQAAPDVAHNIRDITDASTLKALSHPVRIALIEALSLEDAMTATQLGEDR